MSILENKLCEDTHGHFESTKLSEDTHGVLKSKLCEDTHEHFEKQTV